MESLEKLYVSKNILINTKDVLLHENCIYKDNCWNNKSIEKRGKIWNRISFPYIGEGYDGDLMCIGLNLHNCGGKTALNELINGNDKHIGVKNYLKKGIKKINFNNKEYPGTLLFHRVAVYSNIILNNCICPNDNFKLVDIYKKIVFLEAIKCSPKENISQPEPNMYNYCPNKILLNEINILKPKKILIFGRVSDIFKNKYGINDTSIYSKNRNIELFKISIENKIIDIIKIIHPTARGGNKIQLYKELLNVINNK